MNVGPLFCNTNPIASGSLPAPRSAHATNIIIMVSHLLISEEPDCHQNLISSSLYHCRPIQTFALQSIDSFLSNVAYKQTDKQTSTTKNMTSFGQGGNKYIHHRDIQYSNKSLAKPMNLSSIVAIINQYYCDIMLLWDVATYNEPSITLSLCYSVTIYNPNGAYIIVHSKVYFLHTMHSSSRSYMIGTLLFTYNFFTQCSQIMLM